MNIVKGVAKVVLVFVTAVTTHATFPEPYGAILSAVLAAVAVLSRSPLDEKSHAA